MRAGLLRLPTLIPTEADRDLLRRFADARDEGAFAELVRRHGPLVLAVCRRVVSDSHLADDAFQATFVVLARKAATAGVGARLSTWLHSVAVKVSLRARTMAGRRAKRETLTATVPERGITSVPPDDATAVLDEEIDRLPDHLRAAVVLCELRGVGRRDAAKELGIAEGTLSSRLAAARKKLADRLRARGVAPAAAIFPAIFVPTDLAAAAVAVSTGIVELSPHLAQLVEGGMQMTLLTKLKLAAVAVAVAVLTVGGFGGKWGNESAAAPVPKDLADPGVIWVFRPAEGELVGYAPDGKKARTVKFAADLYPQLFFGITRDGQHALVAATKGVAQKDGKAGYDALHADKLTVHLWPLHTDAKPTDTGIGCQYWSRYVLGRDGKTLIVEHDRSPRDPKGVPEHPIQYETVAYDLTTFKGTKRPALEKGFWLTEELANGDRLLAFGQYGSDKRPLQSFHLLPAGSDKPKPLTGDDETDYCALSPGGATLLVTRAFSSKSTPTHSYHRMFVIDRATGKAEPFAHRDNTQHAHGHWSPDGTRVVYEWLEEGPPVPVRNIGGGLRTVPISRAQVVVADASGKSEKAILELEGRPETDLAKAQTWHDARPKLVGWYPTRRNAPVPKANDGEVIWVYKWPTGALTGYAPDGKVVKELTIQDENLLLAITPDGRQMLFAGKNGKRVDPDSPPEGLTLHLRPFGNGDEGTDLKIPFDRRADTARFAFTPDGAKLVRSRRLDPGNPLVRTYTHSAFDVATGKESELKGPEDAVILDIAPDGTWALAGCRKAYQFVEIAGQPPPMIPKQKLYKVPLDGKEPTVLAERSQVTTAAIAPDGKSVLFTGPSEATEKGDALPAYTFAVFRTDVATGKTAEVSTTDKQGHTETAWSPDGKRFVSLWWDHELDAKKTVMVPNKSWLTVCDPAGKVEKAWDIHTHKKGFADAVHLLGWVKARPPAPDAPKKNAPVPKAKDAGLLWVHNLNAGELVAYSPALEVVRRVKQPGDAGWAVVAPDGEWCLFCVSVPGDKRGKRCAYALMSLGDPTRRVDLDLETPEFVMPDHLLWRPDGKRFLLWYETDGHEPKRRYVLFDREAGKEAVLDSLPKDHLVLGWTADGTKLLTQSKTGELCETGLDGKSSPLPSDGSPSWATRLAPVRQGKPLLAGGQNSLWSIDPITGKQVELLDKTHEGTKPHWSPDGSRVAISFYPNPKHEPQSQPKELRLLLMKADGTGRKEITLVDKSKEELVGNVGFLGWFPTAKAPPPKKNAPVPKAKDAGLLWVKDEKAHRLTAYTPALEVAKRVKLHADEKFLGLTPDGASIVYAANVGKADGKTYHVRPVGEDTPGTDLGLDHSVWDFSPLWSPDGKRFLRVRKDVARKVPSFLGTIFRYDVFDLDTKKATHLADLPYDHWVMDWTADGKRFLTQSLRKGEEDTLHLMDSDGTSKPLPAEEKAIRLYRLALSKDGGGLLLSGYDTLWSVDATTGKRKELLDKVHGFPKPAWSPDGKRMAVAYCQFTTSAGPDPWDVQRLAVADADGKNRKEIVLRDKVKNEDAYDAEFLGWFPAMADPVPVPKKNAPVPKAKEETMGLTASVTFDKKEVMLGEPVYFTFAVKNLTDTAWKCAQGGDYRNRLGRPNSFAVTVTGPDGKAVPQPDSGIDMGGMSHLVKLPADGTASFWPLFLPHWATFDKPGEYTVTVKRKVGLVPADAEDGFRAKVTPVNLSATAKITVAPADKAKMGELIESLGKTMLDRKAVGHGVALEKMQAIRDPRVIPHFIELGKRPSHHERTAACEALSRFKTDEAFAALKVLYATTGIDLRESTTTQELADSSANGVRHAAIGAILDCSHPDSLAFGWKTALDDGYYGVRMTVLHKAYEVKSPEARKVIAALLTDADERIRGEAKRYTELLAKEKK